MPIQLPSCTAKLHSSVVSDSVSNNTLHAYNFFYPSVNNSYHLYRYLILQVIVLFTQDLLGPRWFLPKWVYILPQSGSVCVCVCVCVRERERERCMAAISLGMVTVGSRKGGGKRGRKKRNLPRLMTNSSSKSNLSLFAGAAREV